MKKFEWVEHPSDVGFRAYGEDLEEAFENAALALTEVMADTKNIEAKERVSINLEAEDLEALLYDWLDFFIYLYGAKNFVASRFGIENISEGREVFGLEGGTWGEEYDPERHGAGTEVKAVTYHMMEIVREPGRCSVQVVVDI